jgi:hypothetical protein
MEFDTILTEEEIENNISGIIKDDKGLFKNIVTYYVGDITNGLKMEGYINGNSFHLVSYLEFYKKNVEINGSIIDLGNLRKVKFDVNWKKQFDIIILFYLLVLVYRL